MYANFRRKITVGLQSEPMMPYLLNAAFYKKPTHFKCRQYGLFTMLSIWSSGDQMPALKTQVYIYTEKHKMTTVTPAHARWG